MMDEEYDSLIMEIKNCLKFPPGMVDGPLYKFMHKHLATIELLKGNELQGIYHLTEGHGAGIRQHILFREARKGTGPTLASETFSFPDSSKSNEVEGLLRKLEELPQAWTLVQLTREFEPMDFFSKRRPETTPTLKGIHVTRLPCGKRKFEIPVTELVKWEAERDLLELFWTIKKKMAMKNVSHSKIWKIRSEVSRELEDYMKELGEKLFKKWIILFFGRLCDKSLESKIRSRIDEVFDLASESVSERTRYIGYLLGEGCAHLKKSQIKALSDSLVPSHLSETLFKAVEGIKKENPSLCVARRHPVILMLDDMLEIVSWELMVELRRHPVSRMPSIHLVSWLTKRHLEWIDRESGLRAVHLGGSKPGFYLVDPDGNLPTVKDSIGPFLTKRVPNWDGFIGAKPDELKLAKALADAPTYLYCGHGSGGQYLKSEVLQNLNLSGVQMLYGCGSAALQDHGGTVEMTGDVLQFLVAGSGCTLGMLWSVTSTDTDRMTMALANTWLPGTPIDPDTLEEVSEEHRKRHEPELLRTLSIVRASASLFSNGAALIARGIPVKLIPETSNNNVI